MQSEPWLSKEWERSGIKTPLKVVLWHIVLAPSTFLFLHFLVSLYRDLLLFSKKWQAFPLKMIPRKWSKGQLRLQSLMDLLQRERQLDPAVAQELDPDVADAQQEMRLKHLQRQGFRERFLQHNPFFFSKMLPFFCPPPQKKRIDTLWMINKTLYVEEMLYRSGCLFYWCLLWSDQRFGWIRMNFSGYQLIFKNLYFFWGSYASC